MMAMTAEEFFVKNEKEQLENFLEHLKTMQFFHKKAIKALNGTAEERHRTSAAFEFTLSMVEHEMSIISAKLGGETTGSGSSDTDTMDAPHE